jgi:alanine dehydrogenase
MITFGELVQQTTMYPQEALELKQQGQQSLLIGLPKEVSLQENRIALTPESVGILTQNGHRVLVENEAGKGAQYSNHNYSEAGAEIVYSPKEVYEANVVVKVEPVVEAEYGYLKNGQTIISALNVPNLNKSYFQTLNDKQITGIGYEFIEDMVGNFPIIRAMSEIAGSMVLLIAAEFLNSFNDGRGIILGGITGVPPTKVVILGAGTVAEYAARAAIGMGADVKIFDQHIYRLQRLKYALGQPVYTSIIESKTLAKAIGRADVVIGCMRPDDGYSPCVVSEEMVSRMKPKSVIIDVSIDQGGCFETSRMTSYENPTYKMYDVTHYCVPNIASRVSRTASIALSNVFLPMLLQTGTVSGIEAMMYANRWFTKGIYCHKGTLTNGNLAKRFDMRYKDLSLLMATRF